MSLVLCIQASTLNHQVQLVALEDDAPRLKRFKRKPFRVKILNLSGAGTIRGPDQRDCMRLPDGSLSTWNHQRILCGDRDLLFVFHAALPLRQVEGSPFQLQDEVAFKNSHSYNSVPFRGPIQIPQYRSQVTRFAQLSVRWAVACPRSREAPDWRDRSRTVPSVQSAKSSDD